MVSHWKPTSTTTVFFWNFTSSCSTACLQQANQVYPFNSTSCIVFFCFTVLPSNASTCLLLAVIRSGVEGGLSVLWNCFSTSTVVFFFLPMTMSRKPITAEQVSLFAHSILLYSWENWVIAAENLDNILICELMNCIKGYDVCEVLIRITAGWQPWTQAQDLLCIQSAAVAGCSTNCISA